MANKTTSVLIILSSLTISGWSLSVSALDVRLDQYLPYIEVLHDGSLVRVQRIQDQKHTIKGGFAKTSRKCPPFCIQPINVAANVTTVGELEVFQFMEIEVNSGSGVLIDARLPSWYKKGTIPGSINIPFTVFSLEDDAPELVDAMKKLGAVHRGKQVKTGIMADIKSFLDGNTTSGIWDYSEAKDILLWCNGMWCGQSPRAIHGLLKLQYPPEKIHYYRGGMQSWRVLGLTVVVPDL